MSSIPGYLVGDPPVCLVGGTLGGYSWVFKVREYSGCLMHRTPVCLVGSIPKCLVVGTPGV